MPPQVASFCCYGPRSRRETTKEKRTQKKKKNIIFGAFQACRAAMPVEQRPFRQEKA